jgi:hemoglobin/transferrin/lactoferrin receptor protein
MMRFLATTAALSAIGIGAAAAQEATLQSTAEITVTATRTAKNVDEVPNVVSVITAEQIEDQLANDIKDLVQFEPGVSVRQSPSRFTAALPGATGRDGNAGFNIRGLEGNRVSILVDGIRVPDAYSFGAQNVGRGDYVDLDLLKSVEILRGPSSALYGSDGVAGAVSFITKDPADLLTSDKNFGGRVRAAYGSADESAAGGLVLAGQSGAWSGMLAYTYREGHELENQGTNFAQNSTRTTPNPEDNETQSILGKVVFQPSEQNRFRLTLDHYDARTDWNVLTGRAVPPFAATSVIGLTAFDDIKRDRVSFDHEYKNEGGFIDAAKWSVYWQQSETRQFSAEDRFTAADRERDATFDNRVWGASLQLESAFGAHRFTYGGDYSSTYQESLRTGTIPPAGESFPSRAFPNTDYALAGAFIQDEITLMNGQIVLYPAVRYDYYDLSPKPDALYTVPTASQSDSHVSPKLGIVAWPIQSFGVFANYATGFKAPAPSQVNTSFANPVQFYTSLPNPNLEPETSDTFEAGIRLRKQAAGAKFNASFTGFVGDYKNFIDQVQIGGAFTALNPAVYQYINLSDVTISGYEGRAEAEWDNGLGFLFAGSFSDGKQKTNGVTTPLQSIDPVKLVAGLTYREPSGRFGGQLSATHSNAKDAGKTGYSTPVFVPPSFTVVDLTAYWNITGAATLRVGAFNLGDEKYWWWSDVRGVSATSLVTDAYTQPGTNYSVSVSYKF